MFYLYTHHESIFKLTEKYQPPRLDKVLREYSKYSRSVGETKEKYNEITKYLSRKR